MADDFMPRTELRSWLKAVDETGNQLLAMNELMIDLFNDLRRPETQSPARTKLRVDTGDRIRATEHFHLVALKKSLEAAQQLTAVNTAFAPAVSEYTAAVSEARKLRNTREHDWEHFSGCGHHQRDFVHDTLGEDGSVRSRMDASSTRVDGEGYWIGGRYRVQAGMESALRLLTILKEASPSHERPRF